MRDELTLRVFDNRVLKISEPRREKKEQGTG
jgi:hypothetical protein